MNFDLCKLKATFRHNIKNYKKIYPKSHCLLLISVGQNYHEGEHLEAIIECLNQHQFKHCSIAMGDYIQRHTLRIRFGLSEEKAEERSLIDGDKWLKRNLSTLKKLKMPFEIFRWKDWLNHPEFSFFHQQLRHELHTCSSFKESFENSVQEFLTRAQKQSSQITLKNPVNERLCLEYLLEECAIILPLWANFYPFDFIVYPAKKLDAMEATYQKFVLPFRNTLHWLPLRFKRQSKSCNTLEENVCESAACEI